MATPANEIQPGQFIEDDNGEVHQVTDIEETVTDNELTNGKLIIHARDLCLIVEPDHQLELAGMPAPVAKPVEVAKPRRSRPRTKEVPDFSGATASSNGKDGEKYAEGLLRYEGWEIIERQALVHGHVIDLRVKHRLYGEALVEVKVWGSGGGKDTVKKALSDAYDLRECGETTPYILVLSHHLTGQYRDQLFRAQRAGVIKEVRVLGFMPLAHSA